LTAESVLFADEAVSGTPGGPVQKKT